MNGLPSDDGSRDGDPRGRDAEWAPDHEDAPIERLLSRLTPAAAPPRVEATVLAAAREAAGDLRRGRLARRLWLVTGLAAAAVLVILALRTDPEKSVRRDPAHLPGAREIASGAAGAATEDTTRVRASAAGNDSAPDLEQSRRSSAVAASLPSDVALMARKLRLELEVSRLQRMARRTIDRPGYRAQLDLLETTLETIETRLTSVPTAGPRNRNNETPDETKEETGDENHQMPDSDSAGLGRGPAGRAHLDCAIS